MKHWWNLTALYWDQCCWPLLSYQKWFMCSQTKGLSAVSRQPFILNNACTGSWHLSNTLTVFIVELVGSLSVLDSLQIWWLKLEKWIPGKPKLNTSLNGPLRAYLMRQFMRVLMVIFLVRSCKMRKKSAKIFFADYEKTQNSYWFTSQALPMYQIRWL